MTSATDFLNGIANTEKYINNPEAWERTEESYEKHLRSSSNQL